MWLLKYPCIIYYAWPEIRYLLSHSHFYKIVLSYQISHYLLFQPSSISLPIYFFCNVIFEVLFISLNSVLHWFLWNTGHCYWSVDVQLRSVTVQKGYKMDSLYQLPSFLILWTVCWSDCYWTWCLGPWIRVWCGKTQVPDRKWTLQRCCHCYNCGWMCSGYHFIHWCFGSFPWEQVAAGHCK